VTELYRTRRVSSPTYDRLAQILGSKCLVALTVLVGHYNNVAMTLNAHEVSLPAGCQRRYLSWVQRVRSEPP